MARPALHDPSAIIDATLRLAATGMEAVTIAGIGRAAGVPSGSIYHRFDSRDGLLAAAWLTAMRGFQSGFLTGLQDEAGPPGLAAAVHTTDWARTQPHRARALVLHRADDFGAARWPGERREEARRLAGQLEDGLAEFSLRHLGGMGGEVRRRVTFALLDLPFAAVRRYLAAGLPPPPEVDQYLEQALGAVLAPARDHGSSAK
ncbi:MAG: TetR/AcrR family transcriptional regulator [Candidatus Dormibacteraeota bacterium]|nr:TetR/AcrR family transcriptional regulator [Candidatus Dormibacteraeota bacterium]